MRRIACAAGGARWLVSVTTSATRVDFFREPTYFHRWFARDDRNRIGCAEQVRVTVVPRDLVRMDALEIQVAEAAFPCRALHWARAVGAGAAGRADVAAAATRCRCAVGRVCRYGTYLGVKTGLNEAFSVDTPTRDRLVAADPRSAELLGRCCVARTLIVGQVNGPDCGCFS